MLKNANDIRSPVSTKIPYRIIVNWLRVIVLIVLDTISLSLAWLAAERLGTPVNNFNLVWQPGQEAPLLIPILMITLGILAASGLYSTDDKRRSFIALLKAMVLAHTLLLITAFLYNPKTWISRSVFLWAWLLTLVFVSIERFLLHFVIVNLRRRKAVLRPLVFLLGNPEDITGAQKLLNRSREFKISGTADLSIREDPEKWAQMLQDIAEQKVSEVFVCSWQSVQDPIILFWELKSAGIQLRVLPISLDLPGQWSEIKMIGQFTTIRFSPPPIIGGDFWLKRGFDLLASSTLLLLLSIPLLIISISIQLDSPGSIFYKQTRVGLKGRHFKVWKFRTMVANASQLQKQLEERNEIKGGILFKIKDDPRITKVGKLLRQYSLDELPQLINVLRGEMSLVGPRPLPVRDVEKFSETHFLRHEVLPGITGLWQVSGRSNADSEEVFYLDLAYIQHWSLALDCKILLKTIQVVLAREGAY